MVGLRQETQPATTTALLNNDYNQALEFLEQYQ
jgi:hypothetical protein